MRNSEHTNQRCAIPNYPSTPTNACESIGPANRERKPPTPEMRANHHSCSGAQTQTKDSTKWMENFGNSTYLQFPMQLFCDQTASVPFCLLNCTLCNLLVLFPHGRFAISQCDVLLQIKHLGINTSLMVHDVHVPQLDILTHCDSRFSPDPGTTIRVCDQPEYGQTTANGNLDLSKIKLLHGLIAHVVVVVFVVAILHRMFLQGRYALYTSRR